MPKALLALLWLVPSVALAAGPAPDPLAPYVSVKEPVVALTHVTVIDGTGAAPLRDQTIVVEKGRISSVGPAAAAKVPAGARVLELGGATVMPGLVGMHDHLFMTGSEQFPEFVAKQQTWTFPRLYLACGVTTIRTTGSVEPAADLSIKRLVDEGKEPGPKIFVTGPYLEGKPSMAAEIAELRGPDDARKLVDYWAGQGATSFKAYMHITREELGAAIQAAHAKHLKVTGHLCTIGFHDAIALGIDNVEHGFFYDSDLFPGRKGDVCPPGDKYDEELLKLDEKSPVVKKTFDDLIQHHVAVTSTLAVIDGVARTDVPARTLELMAPDTRANALDLKMRLSGRKGMREGITAALKKDMELERAFVKAGGTLLAGADPTGAADTVAGIADQRQLELLVEAGFTPVEAIHIATQNGADFLGVGKQTGTVAVGKQADLVVVRGDPAAKISEVENVELVFKDGVGFDSKKLLESVRGKVGL